MNFATLQTGGFADEDLVKDGWTDISQRIRDRVDRRDEQAGPGVRARDDPEGVRGQRRREDDRDPGPGRRDRRGPEQAAEALKPWYRQLCKRPCFHDEYLQAYNEPGAHLVDTDGKGVERIDETGVWVGGVHYELDCLIFASGFEVGTDYARRSGFETIGRDGETLSEHWADGMQTLHGIHVHGFPNLFIVGLNQGANLISNITHNLVEAGTTIAAVVAHALEVGADEVEVTAGGRAGLGASCSRANEHVVPRQPRLHARLLQQRGPADRPARAAQHERLPAGPGRVLRVHRRLADLGGVRGPRVPSLRLPARAGLDRAAVVRRSTPRLTVYRLPP